MKTITQITTIDRKKVIELFCNVTKSSRKIGKMLGIRPGVVSLVLRAARLR